MPLPGLGLEQPLIKNDGGEASGRGRDARARAAVRAEQANAGHGGTEGAARGAPQDRHQGVVVVWRRQEEGGGLISVS